MTTLKQIKDTDRIIFLKKFTEHLLLSVSIEQQSKQIIKIEKLKQKIFEPEKRPEQIFKKIISLPISENKIRTKEIEKEQPKLVPLENQRKPLFYRSKSNYNRPSFLNTLSRQINTRNLSPLSPAQNILPQARNIPPEQFQLSNQNSQIINNNPQEQDIRNIIPNAEPRPQGFALGKIESFLRDKSVQTIECSGPGKNLLIKRLNKINSTKLSLGQAEITEIINNFARQAKIPIAGGILKAAVGELIISAVISEFVGSRFIINKITPYAILQE